MANKKYGTLTKDKHGVLWVNFNGRRITPNRVGIARALLTELEKDLERERIAAREEDVPSLQGVEVIVLRGIPGSGKTTWAKEFISDKPWFKRICRDDLRQMLDNGEYSANKEKFVRTARGVLMRAALEDGYSVVVDDTNLSRRDISQIRNYAEVYSHVIGVSRIVAVPLRIMDFETPLDVCIERDAQRAHPVGEARIREMHVKHLQELGKWHPSEAMMDDMRKAVEGIEWKLTRP